MNEINNIQLRTRRAGNKHNFLKNCRKQICFEIDNCLSGEVLQDALAVDKLLGNNACYAKHGKAAVVELLGAESVELVLVGGGEAKRIESKIAVDVVLLELGNTGFAVVGLTDRLPS